MRVISFVTQKGGSGKTTLAFCCAVAAQEKGKRTLILDMDPQGTATAWSPPAGERGHGSRKRAWRSYR